jgi:hypothetical protein
MSTGIIFSIIVVGLGATLVLDLWNLFLKHVFSIPVPHFCLVGRWLCHMPSGTFRHASIGAAAQKPYECVVGWTFHYVVGAVFALVFVYLVSGDWLASPALLPALVFGVVTVVFPFFVMHPAFGIGVAASKTPNPTQARVRAFLNHAVFGIGLYISGVLLNYVAWV